MFQMIFKEEQRHAKVLESVIEFVSSPEKWLENAEWYHLEEYWTSVFCVVGLR